MSAPDMEVIKDIPGYKVILKAVLKAQIQQLVEQLASHTEEDSIILTASIHDGTLSHLGTDSGKSFLDDHEDVKSQFLGFCLKYHHDKKQQKEREEKEEAIRKAAAANAAANAAIYAQQQVFMPARSPRHHAPRYLGPRPTRPPAMRHQPYPVSRPVRAPMLQQQSPMKSPSKIDGQIIKIEPEEDDGENSNQSHGDNNVNADNPSGNVNQSPSQPSTPSKVKTSSNTDDDAESSTSTIPNDPTSDTNLGLDSDLSKLISDSNNDGGGEGSEQTDPNITVKLEALTESEMELEITGVEPGRPQVPQDTWDPNVSMGMNFDPTGATGSQGDMNQPGYSERGLKRRLFPQTIETKYKAILEVEKGGKSKKEVAMMFGIPGNTLSGWLKTADKIKAGMQKYGTKRKMRSAAHEDVELAVLRWFNETKTINTSISGSMIREKARWFAAKLGYTNFECSSGWLTRFKVRHGIYLRRCETE